MSPMTNDVADKATQKSDSTKHQLFDEISTAYLGKTLNTLHASV